MTQPTFQNSKGPQADIATSARRPSRRRIAGSIATAALLLTAAGCSSSGDTTVADPVVTTNPPPPPVSNTKQPFEELFDQSIDRYLGVFAPMLTEFLPGDVINYRFDGSSNGPMCYTGSEFMMSTRDGTGSELMIFLQGGGACSSRSCEAVETATAGFPSFGILSNQPANPAGSYNVGYLPYCDGTLWRGDRTVDNDGDGTDDWFFRGVQNLSASLDVIVGRYPSPSRILIAGNSAGGYGTNFALPLVRKLYPDVPIELVNDSGVGITQPGTVERLNEEWNADAFFPDSCPTCIGDDGNLTDYYKYQLAEDTNVRMAFLNTKRDETLVSGTMMDPAVFEAELIAAMADVEAEYPERFGSLIANGDSHTFIIRQFDLAVGGTTVRQWIADLLADSDNWGSVSD